MKITFINPPFKSEYGKFSRENRSPAITRSGTLYYPLWLIYAAAYVEKYGFEVSFLDAPAEQYDFSKSFDYIDSFCSHSNLFVIDTSTPSIMSDIDFANKLKEKFPAAIVVLVGTHVTACAEETLRNGVFDAVLLGEYDNIVLEIAKKIKNETEWKHTKGVAYIENAKFYRNKKMPYIDNLDDIPFASEFIYNHLNYKNYFFAASNYPEIQMFTSRGCMSRCNYCVYPQTMSGHCLRTRTAENIILELEYIKSHFPKVKSIVFEDDTFTTNKERVEKICLSIISKKLNKHFNWLCNARVGLSCNTMKLMKKAGCRLIIPGFESGTQQILNNIKKGITIKQIEQYVADAKKAKLAIHACYMVGNEGETQETMKNTLNFAIKLNTDTAQFYPLIPFPGTEAYEWAKKNDYISGKYQDYCKFDGTINCVLNTKDLSPDELVNFCNYARKKYYLRPKYIFYRIYKGLFNFSDFKRAFKAFMSLKKYLFKK